MNRHRLPVFAVAVLSAAVLFLACGDGGTEPTAPDPPRPTSVTVNPTMAELDALGLTIQLTAEVRDQNGQVMAGTMVAWASDNTQVATVDGSGLVTAAGNGTATITAVAGGASGTAAVTVTQAADSVAVSPAEATMAALGDTLRLAAEAFDANGHAVAGAEFGWSSSDEAVATVDGSGLVTAAGNGTATITATVGDTRGQSAIKVVANRAPETVDSIPPHTMIPGDRASVDVKPFFSDPDGDLLTYAASSSDARVLGVSVSGTRVTVEALVPGTATVTVTASDPTGLRATQRTSVESTTSILTAIRDIDAFLDECPMSDRAYARIRRDFEVRLEGKVIAGPIACSEPATAMSSDQVTYQLKAYQTFRFAYYMNDGTEGRLPWTEKGLYDWMASRISGINVKKDPNRFYCCDKIDGNLYVSASISRFTSRSDPTLVPLTQRIDWNAIATTLSFYAHETRHADEDDPGHVRGCKLFPLPSDPPGCDASYDLNNLGGYGISYWLVSGWATGYLNVGIGCSPRAHEYAAEMMDFANMGLARRFVTNIPPSLMVDPPYGGPCIPPNSPWK